MNLLTYLGLLSGALFQSIADCSHRRIKIDNLGLARLSVFVSVFGALVVSIGAIILIMAGPRNDEAALYFMAIVAPLWAIENLVLIPKIGNLRRKFEADPLWSNPDSFEANLCTLRTIKSFGAFFGLLLVILTVLRMFEAPQTFTEGLPFLGLLIVMGSYCSTAPFMACRPTAPVKIVG